MSAGHLEALEALKIIRAAELKAYRERTQPVTLHKPAKPSKPKKTRLVQNPTRIHVTNMKPEMTEGQKRAEQAAAAIIWKERMGNERYDNRPT